LLASTTGLHTKHALIFAVLTVVFLGAALLLRPRRSPFR
jgi:hypothetical protein